MYGLIQDQHDNFYEEHMHDLFLTNMGHNRKIILEVDLEQNSSNPTESVKCKNDSFIHAVSQVIFKLDLEKGLHATQSFDKNN